MTLLMISKLTNQWHNII